MRPYSEYERYAIVHPVLGPPIPSQGGAFRVGRMFVIASWAEGWDHVSVSRPDRCPTWDEMEGIKRIFFRPEETAMQLHVPESQHINMHPYCLHLWRPHFLPIPMPPAEFVGYKR